ncbi:LOW QUALITY PROTEIN: uncharacterized protein LOC9327541 [Arabidopsis lyrata subsp. lyrata]|uniref:LOW QUALITY PROTEIN: uncharacterized protein LOC9327541 n=1 Tax=Arabidopsis lyrata subsp. lyrata TaxID=81972 RepID=UPI000A29ABFF|nr:LOW QUALITY PROTEIN: uncharacterized protein LOC9327541 [Arabidopsis lyrata subsp. lyrata]|eukprot:XP_002891479.2 LOW QUALITY PROTEIN: uncharacterized protein LOC9327541 [Arabidopsis lyrata subsp. lyrata]
MQFNSAIKAEAAPSVITILNKHEKDMTNQKISDPMEILEGLAVRLHRIEGKVNQMEEKMDMLISLIRSNNEVKIGFVKPRQRACLRMNHPLMMNLIAVLVLLSVVVVLVLLSVVVVLVLLSVVVVMILLSLAMVVILLSLAVVVVLLSVVVVSLSVVVMLVVVVAVKDFVELVEVLGGGGR